MIVFCVMALMFHCLSSITCHSSTSLSYLSWRWWLINILCLQILCLQIFEQVFILSEKWREPVTYILYIGSGSAHIRSTHWNIIPFSKSHLSFNHIDSASHCHSSCSVGPHGWQRRQDGISRCQWHSVIDGVVSEDFIHAFSNLTQFQNIVCVYLWRSYLWTLFL